MASLSLVKGEDRAMRVGIPVFNDRISPVFDTARRLLLVDIEQGQEIGRSEAALVRTSMPLRASRVKELQVDVLLCGAISRPLAQMISALGVTLVPFLAGEVDRALAAYLDGQLPSPQFLMPGCCGKRLRCRRGRGWNA